MKIEVTFQPVFHLPLTHDDTLLLCDLAAKHYDLACQQAGAIGGFLYGWQNRLYPNTEPQETTVPATWREIDLTLKVLERRPLLALHEHRAVDLARAETLARDLRACLDRWPYIKPAANTIDTEGRINCMAPTQTITR